MPHCCAIDLVPFNPRKLHFGSLATSSKPVRVRRSDHRHNRSRVAQDPCNHNRFPADIPFFCNAFDEGGCFANPRFGVRPGRLPGEHSLRKRSPGLERDPVQPAIFDDSFARITILRTLHVGMDCRIMKHGMNWIIFYLIHDDRLIDKGSQQLDLCRRMVADSEAPHLSRPVQEIEGLRDFLRSVSDLPKQ